MKNTSILFLLAVGFVAARCGEDGLGADASGNFEAVETIISAEAAGKILELNIDEGRQLKVGDVIGYIDTTQLHLRKKQLEYSMQAVLAKQPDVTTQLSTVEEQIATAQREKTRVENLLKADAATQKQLDDLNAQIDLLQKQYAATKSSLQITTQSLRSETYPLQSQIDQLEDQIKKSVIVNPVSGTVLTQYTEKNEVANAGKALYKIADLSSITLRAYISGIQLPEVKLGQLVEVLVDEGEDFKTYTGTVTWVSDKAEFTPKTIQTKDERANLVYAIKINVPNDGYLKIGMYGEVKFSSEISRQ